MNGLVLDTSALLAYASGTSVEPGALVTAVPKIVSAAAPPGLEILDISEHWE